MIDYWVEVRREPCVYGCTVWMGPYRHAFDENGVLLNWVEASPDHPNITQARKEGPPSDG